MKNIRVLGFVGLLLIVVIGVATGLTIKSDEAPVVVPGTEIVMNLIDDANAQCPECEECTGGCTGCFDERCDKPAGVRCGAIMGQTTPYTECWRKSM